MNDRKTFAGKYFCYNLVYYEWYPDIREAIGREKEIKGWIRAKKEKLIESFNPSWRFLNDPQEIEKGNLPQWHIGDDYWQPGLNQPPKAKQMCHPERSEGPESKIKKRVSK